MYMYADEGETYLATCSGLRKEQCIGSLTTKSRGKKGEEIVAYFS